CLGASIACSADGAFIVAGAPGVNSNQGAAYIYQPIGSFFPNYAVITGSLCVYHQTTIDSNLLVRGNIHLNGTIVTGTSAHVTACTATLSDKRIKNNVQALSPDDALATLRALQPVTFDFISPHPWLTKARYFDTYSSAEGSEAQAGRRPADLSPVVLTKGEALREGWERGGVGFVAQDI